ncbi:AAA family ATPase [Turicibacter bilis]|uniref:ATP-dependent nuclease n=1 Tax=Turicibacter bilis TaxID=2735723 RepID=UPI001BB013A1|nr:AAA family ATPase [Turicibacter bilis]MBS3201994.1 AAA family ATPase [Turicibacter bilis]UUF10426.1 AAA family ATPase [Turicibacter bilis]
MYLKKLKILGYKKHCNYEITFNHKINILIGENEAGKSTILEAIDIVLNQKYFNNTDTSNLAFFSKQNIDKFMEEKKLDALPSIVIEAIFSIENEPTPMLGQFYGEHNIGRETDYGIQFKYSFDESFMDLFRSFDFENNPVVPIDYYKAEWRTFSGMSYNRRINPLKSLTIDNSINKYGVYDSFAKDLFETSLSNDQQNRLSFGFRSQIDTFLNEHQNELQLDVNQRFSISESKAGIKSLLTIEDNGIVLQHKGKGMESIIKTHRALQNTSSKLILIEEPENHLSHMNLRKLIHDILRYQDSEQLILTTHNPLVVSRLGLNNIIWLSENNAKSFNDISRKATEYFLKVDHTNILQFLLSDKVIIVEGAAEYILLEKLFKAANKPNNISLDDCRIEVISGGGITYDHYIEVAEYLNKPLLVLTDNDGDENKITTASTRNSNYQNVGKPIKIQMPNSVDISTFEIALFNSNQDVLKNLTTKNAKTTYKEKEYDRNLAFMLNNKSQAALRIENTIEDIVCPDYIAEGLEWLMQY